MEPEVVTTEVAAVPEVPTKKVAEVVVEEPVIVEQPPVQKKETAQEAIDRITRKRREAEREAEYWKAKALQAPEPVQPKAAEGRPKIDQFETTESYEDALLVWHENKKVKETTIAEHNRQRQESQRQFEDKSAALRTEHDDYDEVINAPIFTEAMKSVLLTSDNGPGLAYYLGSNRDIANKIAQLPADRQAYELGKLETQFLIAKKTKKVTTAPEPIIPGSGMGGASKIDESKLNDDEWFKLEQERLKNKLKKRTGG